MKARLTLDVALSQVSVFAELATLERRPELQLLCGATPPGGALGSAEVDGVLPGLSDAGKKNLLRHLSYLRLTERDGRLTALGRRCAASGEAPSWELGAYTFVAATHPFLGCHLVEFARERADSQDRDFESLKAIPAWFRPDANRVWTSALDRSTRYTVGALSSPRGAAPLCRTSDLGVGKLAWELDPETGVNAWHLEGTMPGERGPVEFKTAPESVPTEKVAGVYAAWEPRWNKRTRRVGMAYDGKARSGHETFTRTLPYPEVTLSEFGSFRDVQVESVPVGPANAPEARAWATALATARVASANVYCSPSGWLKTWESVVAGTPLEATAGAAPLQSAVIAAGTPPLASRLQWLLQAPSDLTME